VIRVNEARQREAHRQSVKGGTLSHGIRTDRAFVLFEVGIQSLVRAGNLRDVAIPIVTVSSPAPKSKAQIVRVEMLLSLGEPGRVMRSNQPRGKILVARAADMCYAGINVIPRKAPFTTLAERALIVGIEFAEIMKDGRRFNRIDESVGR
jgi:hypothetical protein